MAARLILLAGDDLNRRWVEDLPDPACVTCLKSSRATPKAVAIPALPSQPAVGALPVCSTWKACPVAAQAALARLLEFGRGTLAIKLDAPAGDALAAALPDRVALVILATSAYAEWPALARVLARNGRRILSECTSEDQARFAVTSTSTVLSRRAGKPAGDVGEETTFVLVQRLLGLGLPVFAAGGISPHTAAACQVAGCAGVIIDAALALTRESKLPAALRAAVERTEGDDTACVGAEIGERFRLHRKPGSRLVEELEARERQLAGLPREAARAAWRAEIDTRRGDASPVALLPFGQRYAALPRRWHGAIAMCRGPRRVSCCDHRSCCRGA